MTTTTDHETVMVALAVPVTDEQARYLMTTALEGGIGYWAIAKNVQRGGKDLVVQMDLAENDDWDTLGDECTWHTMMAPDVRRGIAALGRLIASGIVHANSKIGRGYFSAVSSAVDPSAAGWDGFGEADATLADAVVQCALFGEEVRYG